MTHAQIRRFLVLVPVLSCYLAACATSTPPAPTPVVKAAPPSTAQLLRSATVNGIYESGGVTLRDGVYEGPPFAPGGASRPTVRLLEPLTTSGELDGGSGDEIVALLAENSGGSGEQIYLAVFRPQGSSLANVATALLGDRIKLRRLDVDAGTIVLDVVQAAPGEPMCCGTQLARKTYRLESGRLTQVRSQVVGRLSLAAISRVEWVLQEMNGKPIVDGSRAPTFAIQGDTASGFAGCNRFSGAIKETAPGTISLGDLAATVMACEDAQTSIEDEYLRSLRRVSSYTFLAGRLALSWEGGGEQGLLLFGRK
jgi:heat shock protein HslJ